MTKTVFRIASLMLALVMILSVFAACQPKSDGNNYITLNGKEVPIPYALKVGDKEISMETYRYYFLTFKSNFDYGDESYWEQHPEDEETLKEYALNYCTTNAAAEMLAESYGLAVTEEDMALIDAQIESQKSRYETDEEWQAALDNQYTSEEFYRSLVEQSYLQQKVMSYLFEDGGEEALEDEDAYIAENYVRAQHILIADKTTAEDVLSRVKSGEDFVKLMTEYGEDPGASEDGYTFTYGEMVTEFEEATFALEENEISDLVQSTYGYHIIKRLPLDQTYIDENKESLIATYQSKRMYEILDEFMADKEVVKSDYYDQFGIDTIVYKPTVATSSSEESAE